jgi:thiol-disulfide isomerase/thioredoxin
VVASTLEKGAEKSIRDKPEVNSNSYRGFHSAQMFEQGFSFSGFERNKVWINEDGAFADLSDVSGADNPNDSRAAVMADFDDDGDIDLFVHNIQRERHDLYRNDAAEGGFLSLALRATTSQHEAIGATVVVHGPRGAVARVNARGDAFLSSSTAPLHFGLGSADAAEVEVLWPGGKRESFGRLAAGTRALLVEGTGRAEPRAAHPRPLPDPLPPGLRASEGEVLAPLLVADGSGSPVRLDLREIAKGKPVLLNFWASYCTPCVAELPLLAERHATGEQRVVAISVDAESDLATARARLAEAGASFPSYYLAGAPEKGEGGAQALAELLDLDRFSLPTTLVVSPEGRIETILRGPLRAER